MSTKKPAKEKPLSRKALINRNAKLLKQLRHKKDGELDVIINNADKQAFKKISCLDCGNCCKTTGPRFTSKDVSRISKYLRMKPRQFSEQYLREDEEFDFVLKQVPCTFLGADNYCSIYDVRPKSCSEFPMTHMRSQKKMLPLMMKNASICPAVESVLDELINNVMTHPKEKKMPD